MLKQIVAVALLVGGVPALAQSNADPAKKDPNRKICEKVEEIGSLVATRRVCMTAQQWEKQRQLNGEAPRKSQKNSGAQSGR